MKTDIHHLISKMPELEVVDCFNAIERHLLGEIQVILPFLQDYINVSGCCAFLLSAHHVCKCQLSMFLAFREFSCFQGLAFMAKQY